MRVYAGRKFVSETIEPSGDSGRHRCSSSNSSTSIKNQQDIMPITLKRYTTPQEYPGIYFHNYGQIDAIDSDLSFDRLVTHLAAASGLHKSIINLEIKKYLMSCQQFYPGSIRKDWKHLFLPFALLFKSFKREGRLKKGIKAEIIIDGWYPGAAESFYGKELISKLENRHKTLCLDLRKLDMVPPGLLLKYSGKYIHALSLCAGILRVHGLDLRRFVYRFFIDLMTGNCLNGVSPKLVLSGHDNGCPTIKAKAAGVPLLLIQNAYRPHYADTCFRFADHYVALGEKQPTALMVQMGCMFKKISYLGSLRLYNYLHSMESKNVRQQYDILCISTGLLCYFDTPGSTSVCFSLSAELKTLQMYKDLAEKEGLRIAYHPLFTTEPELLKKYGVFSEKVTYIDRDKQSVYAAAHSASFVVCVISTLAFESIALGKKVALLNLSGNSCFNTPFAELNIEFVAGDSKQFCGFIRKLRDQELDYSSYVCQDKLYVDKVVGISFDLIS